jgi:hypothetical protein
MCGQNAEFLNVEAGDTRKFVFGMTSVYVYTCVRLPSAWMAVWMFIFGIEKCNRHGSVVGECEHFSSINMVPSHRLPRT